MKISYFSIILVIMAMLSHNSINAQSCFAGWDYFQVITYTNTTGQAITDIQVPIEVNTDNLVMQGKLNPDGSDLRFCGMSCNPLHFYADSAMSSSSNTIWVKLPYVANGASMDILMYYGNASMTVGVADGDSTFIFFDDFEDNSIDASKWETFGAFGLLEETGGTLRYESTTWLPDSRWKYVKTAASFNQRVSIDMGEYHDNNHLFGYAMSDVPLSRLYQRPVTNSNDTLRIITISDTTSNGFYSPGSMDFPFISVGMSQWNDLSINITPVSNGLEFNSFVNHTGGNSATGPYNIAIPGVMGNSAFHVCLSSFTMQGNPAGFSYIKVRNGNHDMAPLSPGTEQPNLFTSVNQNLRNHISTYPNPFQDRLTIQSNLGELGFIQLYDSQGRLVRSESVNVFAADLDVQSLQKGIYTLVITNQSGTVYEPIVKN